jgi:transcriptional regulator with XRE-family HTH domain
MPRFFAKSKTAIPRIGDALYIRNMKLQDKLQMLMARNNLNGQRLARLSFVSDSEISRILQGKSRPGLDNAFRLAKAVGVSLDFLADDTLDVEPTPPSDKLSPEERKILAITQKIGCHEVMQILETLRFLGYEVAMSRLVGGKPVIEIERDGADVRPALPASSAPAAPRTVSAAG